MQGFIWQVVAYGKKIVWYLVGSEIINGNMNQCYMDSYNGKHLWYSDRK